MKVIIRIPPFSGYWLASVSRQILRYQTKFPCDKSLDNKWYNIDKWVVVERETSRIQRAATNMRGSISTKMLPLTNLFYILYSLPHFVGQSIHIHRKAALVLLYSGLNDVSAANASLIRQLRKRTQYTPQCGATLKLQQGTQLTIWYSLWLTSKSNKDLILLGVLVNAFKEFGKRLWFNSLDLIVDFLSDVTAVLQSTHDKFKFIGSLNFEGETIFGDFYAHATPLQKMLALSYIV